MSSIINDFINDDFEELYNLVHRTVDEIYPLYYPKQPVEFFHKHHSIDNMKADIPNGRTIVIKIDNKIAATGSLVGNEIKRMFVSSSYQRQGLGSLILKELEKTALEKGFNEVVLNSSLSSYKVYQKRGYEMTDYHTMLVDNNQFLSYFDMRKDISNTNDDRSSGESVIEEI